MKKTKVFETTLLSTLEVLIPPQKKNMEPENAQKNHSKRRFDFDGMFLIPDSICGAFSEKNMVIMVSSAIVK